MDRGTAHVLRGYGMRQSAVCLTARPSLYPDQDALVFPQLNLRWSWRELDERVNQAAAWLIELGVAAGRASSASGR